MSDFEFTPSQARKEIIELLECGLRPFLTSGPGIGKSAIVAQIAKDFDLELIDLRLSQHVPEDFMGLPMKNEALNRAQFIPFDLIPTETTPVPKGKKGFLLFLDEFNSAMRGVLSASYKIIYDGMVGMERLHPDTFIVLAGNRAEDNAIVNDIGTALQSRVVHLPVKKSLRDFQNYGYKTGFDSRVLGFLEVQPDMLHQFDPNHENLTFACPRTWEFVSKYMTGRSFDRTNVKTLAGMVSEGPAVSFYGFLKEFDRIPRFDDIIKDPQGTKVPMEDGTQWATISMLLAKFDSKNFSDIGLYMNRFPAEMQIVFFRGVAHRDPKMSRHPDFQQAIKKLGNFIHDDDDTDFSNLAA